MHAQVDEPRWHHPATPAVREALIRAFLKSVRTTRRMPDDGTLSAAVGCPAATIEGCFGGLDGLCAEAFERLFTAVPESFTDLGQAGRSGRIRLHVAQRAAAWEWLLPFWKVIDAQETALPDLSRRLDRYRRRRCQGLTELYAPELRGLAPDRRATTLLMVDLLTDLPAWGRLREHEGLSAERAEQLWTWTVDRMMPGGSRDAAGWHVLA